MSKIEELQQRYTQAMHGMQAGVAIDEANGAKDLTPKHLRVGINSALVDSGALATLLIKKGLITEEEYFEALAEGAEREHREYEERISLENGVKVTLR